MRAWLTYLVVALTGALSASAACAQPLGLDPAFMAIVAPAECSQYGPTGTSCSLYSSSSPPTALVALAQSSEGCRYSAPWDVCIDGPEVLEKMTARGGDRTQNVSFDYSAGGRVHNCSLSVSFTESEKKWGTEVTCGWEEDTAETSWFSTHYPSGSHLVGINGMAYVSILCGKRGPALTYRPDSDLAAELRDGTKFELGFESDSPKEPPPYETIVEATGTDYQIEATGDEARAFLFTLAKARKYIDVGTRLPSGSSINTGILVDGSSKDAVRDFLQSCP